MLGVRFATDRETGEFRGFGHVDFADENGPEKAVAMAGTPVCACCLLDWVWLVMDG